MHYEKQDQIKIQSKARIGAFIFDKAFTALLPKYSNYSNIFLARYATKLTKIDNHAINLKKDKQLTFSLIYSLILVKLKILKTYIEVNLANSFIMSSKSPAKIPIFFD